MTELQQLAKRLRDWVRDDGRSREEIAKAAGISRAAIYKFMNPDHPASWKVMQSLLKERDRDNGNQAA